MGIGPTCCWPGGLNGVLGALRVLWAEGVLLVMVFRHLDRLEPRAKAKEWPLAPNTSMTSGV
jgi:hypothetical protein